MASPKPSSPQDLTKYFDEVSENQGGIGNVIDEDITPFISSGEVGDVPVGVGEKTLNHGDTLTDTQHVMIKGLRWDLELTSSSAPLDLQPSVTS